MPILALVRHGESIWNKENLFTGWVDVPLSAKGIKEALLCAKKLKKIDFEVSFTSELERAQETLSLVLSKQNKVGVFVHKNKKEKLWSRHLKNKAKKEIPVFSSEALNERYYGDLQGMNKSQARKKFGTEKVFEWRRSYDTRPPHGESLKDVYFRTLPFFKKKVLPELKKGKDVLISAHGNSLRAIVKNLEGISDRGIPFLELPLGEPIIYEYKKGKLKRKSRNHSFTRPIIWK